MSNTLSSGVIIYDATPFVIKKYPRFKKFEIEHSEFDHFYLTGYYYGRSSFTLQMSHSWKNEGLSGLSYLSQHVFMT